MDLARRLAAPMTGLRGGLGRYARTLSRALLVAAASTVFASGTVFAQCQNCGCNSSLHDATRGVVVESSQEVREWIKEQFDAWIPDYLILFFFDQNLNAAMMEMAEQLQTTGMLQIESVGAMFDAQEQLDTQMLLQKMTARAHKDYQPDTEICTLASTSRSLGASYRTGVTTTHVLAKREMDRDLGTGAAISGGGREIDKRARYEQVRATYCNAGGQYQQLTAICKGNGGSPNIDHDVNYTETVTTPQTIVSDFIDGQPGTDGQHVLALAANLYANDTFEALQNQYFRNPKAHFAYLDVREVAAKRAVAEFSFDSIIGMKSSGTTQGQQIKPFFQKIYSQLGMSDDDIQKTMGDKPSYNSMMDMMTKQVFLRPDFYVNLYAKPANVRRMGAVVQAADLMQDMDKYNSQLRMEMGMSQILEAEVDKQQEAVQEEIDRLTTSGFTPKGGTGTAAAK